MTKISIPAGLWLRSDANSSSNPDRTVDADTQAFRAVPEDTRFTLLVGSPGEPMPAVAQIADEIRALETATRDRLVLTAYGREPSAEISLAQQLADLLAMPVRAHHGLVLADRDGTAHRTAVDTAGLPSWRPFAQLSTYWPGRVGAVLDRWRAPFPGSSVVGPGWYRLTDEWILDVVPAGLVARPAATAPNPLLRCAPTDPERVDLVVDAPPGERLPDDMLTALGRVADALPTTARSRLRVLLTAGVLEASVRSLRWAVPAPQDNWYPPGIRPEPEPAPVEPRRPVPAAVIDRYESTLATIVPRKRTPPLLAVPRIVDVDSAPHIPGDHAISRAVEKGPDPEAPRDHAILSAVGEGSEPEGTRDQAILPAAEDDPAAADPTVPAPRLAHLLVVNAQGRMLFV